MIPLPGIRDKGGGPRLGAKGPGQTGPFGPYGAAEDDGGGLDDEDDQDHDEPDCFR
ncbi:hypothetical protein [Streptomyces scabiei]|uniref:hypothetical protein n=1 Tax=Streptomyces scabiei TaxID=1930 RepID=UPI001B343B4B|nr:hypothetical protein [Streptomyces sp. LBUM 1486]